MFKIGDSIELIDSEVDKFIEENQHRLSGDAMRSLKWTEHADYYFVCEFNDGTSLIHETTAPEYLEEDEKINPYHSALIVPNEIFKKAKKQKNAIYNIEVPVKGLTADEYGVYDINEYKSKGDNDFNKMMEEIERVRKYMSGLSSLINSIVISYALNPDIEMNKEIRIAYPINTVLKFISPGTITLLCYALNDGYETSIKKDDNWLSYLFDMKSLLNEVIHDTYFINNRFSDRTFTEDGYTESFCNLKLGFANNGQDFVIKFEKTEELMNFVYNSDE